MPDARSGHVACCACGARREDCSGQDYARHPGCNASHARHFAEPSFGAIKGEARPECRPIIGSLGCDPFVASVRLICFRAATDSCDRFAYFDFLRPGDPRRPAPADGPILSGSDEVSDKCCVRSEAAGAGSGWSGTLPTISSEATGVDAGWSGTVPPMSWRLAQASHFSQFSCSSALACSKDGAMPANRIMPGSAHTPLMAQTFERGAVI
jgi:hypothetical protein